jgi:hypothetical protein
MIKILAADPISESGLQVFQGNNNFSVEARQKLSPTS